MLKYCFNGPKTRTSEAEDLDALKPVLRSVVAGLIALADNEMWATFKQEGLDSDASQQGQDAQPADAPPSAETRTSSRTHGRSKASSSNLHSRRASKAPSVAHSSNVHSGKSSGAPSIRYQILPLEGRKYYDDMEAAREAEKKKDEGKKPSLFSLSSRDKKN